MSNDYVTEKTQVNSNCQLKVKPCNDVQYGPSFIHYFYCTERREVMHCGPETASAKKECVKVAHPGRVTGGSWDALAQIGRASVDQRS